VPLPCGEVLHVLNAQAVLLLHRQQPPEANLNCVILCKKKTS
jgi:hypothetical protein